jgi:glucose-6-phosphate 1-epimerase
MCRQVADANNPAEKKEERDVLSFEGPTDSVYLGAPEHVELDVGTGAMRTHQRLLPHDTLI